MEDGRTILPLSVGAVREDGEEYYAEWERSEIQMSMANQWVVSNVLPHLSGDQKHRVRIASELIQFAGSSPEFWAYYADYDWVVLCQLYGCMVDLPAGWPMFCMDLKQLAVSVGDPTLPEQRSTEHHALADALWVRDSYNWLNAR